MLAGSLREDLACAAFCLNSRGDKTGAGVTDSGEVVFPVKSQIAGKEYPHTILDAAPAFNFFVTFFIESLSRAK